MLKLQAGSLIGTVKNNLKGTTERFVASGNAFSFMSSVKETACCKKFLFDLLVMVKQLGIATYFPTLSCADLGWDKLSYIIKKLNNLGTNDKELKSLSYQEHCHLLHNNPVLVARYFQNKVKYFSKISYTY